MRVPASLVIVSLASAALRGARSAETYCTKDQEEQSATVTDGTYATCLYVLGDFEVCDEACRGSFANVANKAPSCFTLGSGGKTQQELALALAQKCEDAHTNTTNKYTPFTSKGLAECTIEQKSDWNTKYAYNKAYEGCVDDATQKSRRACSDSCVKTIEEGVNAAPICLDTDDYSMRELRKADLIHCLNVRGAALKDNAVLQSKATMAGLPTAPPASPSTSDSTTAPSPPAAIKPSAKTQNQTTTGPAAASASGMTTTGVFPAAILAISTIIAVIP